MSLPLAPRQVRRSRPSREAILEARSRRRRSDVLFVTSIAWALGAAILLAASFRRLEGAPLGFVVGLVLPAVVFGILAGRRIRPAYLPALFISATFAALIRFLVPVPLMCGAVLLLGYGFDAARALLTGGRVFEIDRPEADAPRAGGNAVSAAPPAIPSEKPTVASASPTGSEFRKRWN